MVAESVANLRAKITADASGFNKGMAQVSAGARMAGGNFSRLASVGAASFAAIGVAAAAAGVAITAGFATKATKLFIEFEDSLIRTQAIMGDLAEGAMPRLEGEIRRLGMETRSSAVEVAKAAQTLALAGVTITEMVDDKALENLNALAIAAGTDMETAAGIAIAAVKGFRMELSDLGNVSDVLVNTFTQSFTTIETLGETMKLLGPTASSAGIAFEEAAAAAGALGNAGLQGTLAGTGLRMAITKLLAPTDDARKVISELGLDVFRLSPAGQSAQNTLTRLNTEIAVSKAEAERTTMAMQRLTAELTDMSIEQQKNNLAIMTIRRRAEREGRELNSSELEQITRLEGANSDLAISMEERRIEEAVMRRDADKTLKTLSEQEAQFTNLSKELEMQTTGITSLSDVLTQLAASGATTTQILEVFGVRGGTAIQSLLGQREAFEALAKSNLNAAGRTEEFSEVLRGSTRNALLELNSAFDEFLLKTGAPFAAMLVEEMIPALQNLIVALTPHIPAFADLAGVIGREVGPFMEELVPIMQALMENIKTMVPFIFLLAKALRAMMTYLEPVFAMLGAFSDALLRLFEGDFNGFISSLLEGFLEMFKVMQPVVRLIEAAVNLMGIDTKDAQGRDNTLGNVLTGAAAGATIGSVVPGVGTVAGGAIGAAAGLIGATAFADGGIVTQPTLGLVGEAGPEAIIPLSEMRKGGRDSESPPALTINGGIHIGAGNNLTKGDVQRIMEDVLPNVIARSSIRQTRGVI